MKFREIIFIIFIISYTSIIFAAAVIDKSETTLNSESQSQQMVELFGNGTTRSFEMENQNISNGFSFIGSAFFHFVFAFPFVLAGIGIWGMAIVFVNPALPVQTEIFHQWLLFFIPSIISIPATAILSTKIPLWRRIPYIYFVAMLISGTPIFMNGDFGR